MTTLRMVELDTVVARSPEVVYTEVGGDVTIMSVESGKYFRLSGVGARVWSIVDEPATIAQVCSRLLKEYRVERDRCETEVVALVRQLVDERIMRVVETTV